MLTYKKPSLIVHRERQEKKLHWYIIVIKWQKNTHKIQADIVSNRDKRAFFSQKFPYIDIFIPISKIILDDRNYFIKP